MRKSSQINKKNFTPLLFCSVLVLQQAMLNAADASTITDGNGVAIEKHPSTQKFEIRPDFYNGKVGFKKYQDMNLSKGDIMNFIFQAYKLDGNINGSQSYLNDVNTFINLVQNQINLNGVVNAVETLGGQIKPDSNLVFVSPNGMIVGASGVLNVGSLNVYTPTQSQFDVLYNGIGTAPRDPSYGTPYAEETTMTWNSASIANGNAPITINGKVIARGDIGLAANTVTVAKATGGTTGGFLLAGINTGDLTALTDEAAANTLFNTLVNVDNMNTGSGFANSNGKIVITSAKGVSVDADSAVKNYANNGIVSITNGGSDGISLAGEVSNGNGTLAITNVDGALTQASTGVLKNKGTMTVTNTASGTGLTLDGTVINDGTMTITNESGADGLYIGGSVTNNTGSATIHNQVNKLEIKSGATVTSNGTSMEISNCGVNGLKVAGSVYNNTGAGTIANADTSTVGGLEITGFVQNDGSSLNVINSGAGGLIVANGGKVLNKKGTATLSNTVNKLSINAGGVAENKGDALYISNSGDNGLSIAGNVLNNSGILGVQNTEDSDGGIDISGLVQNDGSQMQISNFGFGDLNVTGKVLNNTGYARIENNHAGLNVASLGVIENNADQDASVALEITNNGEYDLSIAGKVLNKAGSAVITNNGDTLDISGLVQNDGSSMTITNNGLGGLNVSGTVDNTNGNLHMNSTEFNFEVTSDGVITNSGDNATLTNTGEEGFNIKGKVHNQTGAGDLLISQDAFGDLRVSGKVINDGSSLEMVNGSDSENFDISGSVTNNNGTATLTNNGVYFDVSGTVTTDNNSTSLVMSNAGTGHFTISRTVDNNAGTADLINEGTTFTVTNTGKIINDGTSLYMGNTGTGDFNIDGTVTNNKNEVSIVNGGTNTKLAINGTVTNIGSSLEIANSGKNGIIIAGNVKNSSGTASITNEVTSTVGGIDISGTVKNDGTSLDITNYGAGGLNVSGLVNNTSGDLTMLNDDGGFNVTADGSIYNVGSDALLENSGSDGFNINGTVHNQTGAGTMDIINGSGKLIVGADGEVINDGTALKMTNKSGASDFEINGNVTNNKGTATLVNNGVTFKVTTTGNVVNGGTSLTMSNSGTGGFIIDGLVDNNSGNLTMQNEAGEFNITSTGVVTNSGEDANLSHTGTRTDFVIDGKVHNESGAEDLNILNESVYGKLTVGADGEVINDGTSLNMTNAEGAGNFEIAGNVTNNNGLATLLNQGSTFDVSGTVTSKGTKLTMTNSVDDDFIISGKVINNKGTAEIINDAEIFHITADGRVENSGDKLIITNNGEGGLLIDGNVVSTNGITVITNTNDDLTLSKGATIQNDGTSLEVTNSGVNGMSVAGNILNTKGTAIATNTAGSTTGGLNISGVIQNSGTSLDVINNGAGGLNLQTGDEITAGGSIVNYNGDLTVTNTAGGLNIQADSDSYGSISNAGDNMTITNSGAGGLNVKGEITHNGADAVIKNTNGALNITGTTSKTWASPDNNYVESLGRVVSYGESLTIENSGTGGLNISGEMSGYNPAKGSIVSNAGTLNVKNTNGALNVTSTGEIISKGTSVTVENSGAGGMNIQGIVKHDNTAGQVEFINLNSDMTVGHDSNEYNIDSNADVNIKVTNGNLLNYGVDNILIRTTNGADLVTTVTDGSVGLEVGPCDGGVCTGVGPAERDLTKSINTNIDGTITIDNTGDGALVNLASIDKDMHVNRIHSDGRVILLADDKDKGASPYSILNKSDDNLATPNLKGSGISAIASGNIGESKTDRITFVQTGVDVEIANEHDDATQDHELYTTPLINNKAVGTEYVEGVEFLAIGDINIKGLDDENGNTVDTKVCTISSREGTVNAEFSGDTYIRDITAQNEVNVVTRGTEMYIENLGGAPSRYATTGDYYGDYTGIVPEKATVQALDMGTEYAPNEEPNSTVVIKNGTINGKGSTSHPNLDQDVTVTADNAYVGGYYFNMGKHRMPGLSSVTPDDTTNPLVNGGDPDTPVSIRGKAVRPDDVTATGEPEDVREYYYGYDPDNGETPDDAGPDGDVPGSGQRDDETFDPDKEKADDLVVPEPEPQEPPAGDDDDDQPDPPPAGDDDDDDQPVTPPPADDDKPEPPVLDEPEEEQPKVDQAIKQTWKKEYTDYIEVIDKRQYMRFDTEYNQNPVAFNSESQASGILNISRGGVQLSHDKSLKVGDVVPVHIKYGDVEINTDVKVVSTTDKTAGAEFVDLDLATKNKILYLSLLEEQGERPEGEFYADIKMKNDNLSTTSIDD